VSGEIRESSSNGVDGAVSKRKLSKGSSGDEEEGVRLRVWNTGCGMGM
jgi:hypothetical protein